MNKQPKLIQKRSEDWLPLSPLFTNQHVRGFLSESGVVFNFVQRISRNQELLSYEDFNRSSRKYRSVIHSWFIKIEGLLKANTSSSIEPVLSTDEQNELFQISQLLHKMEIAWHLCEILYVNIQSPNAQLGQLVDWIKWHFTSYMELADQVISSDLPQMHEYYWDVILFLVLRGDMEDASLVLQLHSESGSEPTFMIVSDLLRKYPVLKSNHSVSEHWYRWDAWHDSVLQALKDPKFTQDNKHSTIQLGLLVRLLAGDLDAFKQVAYLFSSWFQMMVGYLLFTDQYFKSQRLDVICDDFINLYYSATQENKTQIDEYDELLRSAFNYDLIDVIKRASVCFDDQWWFVTHFVDLFYNSIKIDHEVADIDKIRHTSVVEYANFLFIPSTQFWQLGIEYLVHCQDSQGIICINLERIPAANQQQLNKLIALACRFNLPKLEQGLCRIESRKWLHKAATNNNHKYGSALIWAIRSLDRMLINHIVDKYLQHYLLTAATLYEKQESMDCQGELSDMDVIVNIGDAMTLSDRLIFLCKYYEFHQLRKNAQFRSAAKILVDMLASNATPEYFVFQVILDCLPLLESPEVVIGRQQTTKILASLSMILAKIECTSQPSKPSVWSVQAEVSESSNGMTQSLDGQWAIIRTYQRNIMKKYGKMLRLAITRNHARSFVLVTPTCGAVPVA